MRFLVGGYLLYSQLFQKCGLFGCWVSALLCVVKVKWVVWLLGICFTVCCYGKVGCLVGGYLLHSVLFQ